MSNSFTRPTNIFVFPNPMGETKWDTEGNPHPRILFEGIKNGLPGSHVDGLSARQLLSKSFLSSLSKSDVVIVHWTDGLLGWPIWATFFERVTSKIGIPSGLLIFLQRKLFFLRWRRRLFSCEAAFVWVVHEVAGHGKEGRELGLDYLVRRILNDRCDAMAVLELSTVPEIVKMFGKREVPIVWSPIGDIGEFHGPKLSLNAARRKLKIPPSKTVVLLFGSRRMARDPAAIFGLTLSPSLHFILAGPGFEPLVGKVNPAKFTVLGFLSREEVATVLSSADYVINHGANYLNSGVVRLAISYGKPVIAFPFGANRDLANGCIVKLHKDVPISTVLNSLPARDSLRYKSMVEAAARANSQRPWELSVRGIIEAVNLAKQSRESRIEAGR